MALEQRVDADLALGRHRELVGELDELATLHPLHEPFAQRLMLALYRSGRQGDALEVYRRTRATLSDGFGIEPGRKLHELERAILNQDPALQLARPGRQSLHRTDSCSSFLRATNGWRPFSPWPSRLRRLPGQALLIARLLPDETSLASTAASLNLRRASLGVETRTAAFTSVDPVADAVRLASAYDVRLVLVDAAELDAVALPEDVASIVERAPADVGVLAGSDLDWARAVTACSCRLEAAPTTGRRSSSPPGSPPRAALPLPGSWARGADPARGRRDASRLLADAALAVQRVGRAFSSEPLPRWRPSGRRSRRRCRRTATLVVQGISPRWRRRTGIGAARRVLLREESAPTRRPQRGRARAVWPRARAARASPGRSSLIPPDLGSLGTVALAQLR